MTAMPVGVSQIADLLNELSQVQTELLEFLQEKRAMMSTREPEMIAAFHEREQELSQRLQQCHDRRAALLAEAGQQGMPDDSLTSLTEALPAGETRMLRQQMQETSSRMRLLQHHSLTNWVLAQRALLHVSQLLEILATGGRMQPTYGNASSVNSRGSLLNSEA
jgi:flagellar biosynthesis/type III secretory pathway chaperone